MSSVAPREEPARGASRAPAPISVEVHDPREVEADLAAPDSTLPGGSGGSDGAGGAAGSAGAAGAGGEVVAVPRRRQRVSRSARLAAARVRERQHGLAALAVLVALALAVGVLARGDGDRSIPAGAADRPAPADASEAAARHFLDAYVDPDGRVVRRDQGGDTVSEGQAYALLLAVALDDAATFAQVWSWTQSNLQRPDALLSWHWRDGDVRDPSSAADADIDAARALLLAAERFGEPAYRREAIRLAQSIRELETGEDSGRPVLLAGPWATTAPRTVNPSYFDPRAFALLGEATGDPAWWGELAEGGYAVVEQLRESGAVLPPDWAHLREVGGARVIGNAGQDGNARYSYDAARLPVRFAAACDARGLRIAASWWPVFADTPPDRLSDAYDLDGEPVGASQGPVVMVAAAAAALAAGEEDASDDLLDAAQARDRAAPSYYGAAWVALGRVLLTTDDLGACPG